MKKLIFSFFIVALLFSCKKDDKSNSELVIGTWNTLLISYSECEDDDDNYSIMANSEGFIEEDGEIGRIIFDFSSNGVVRNYTEIYLDGSSIIIEDETYPYTVNDTQISISESGDDIVTATLSLSSSEMTWNYIEDDCTVEARFEKL